MPKSLTANYTNYHERLQETCKKESQHYITG